MSLRVAGKGVQELFGKEAGGHRWQRIPPNERRGRVHTSTVTVAVLEQPPEGRLDIKDSDFDVRTCRGSGAGGQNRNMTDSAVQITHRPTGLMVRMETERSQRQNLENAKALIRARLWAAEKHAKVEERNRLRQEQVGSGMRGDKRRTIRVQDGQVNDHLDGRHWKLKEYLRGEW